ncbi:MAG: P1 family peptidase [Alphaproteobacteria bacterium]|nr:P1 family peptidase [Alphaproteobacteria bacterium]
MSKTEKSAIDNPSGPQNLITDIAGLRVGNAGDAGLKSGVTVLLGDRPFVAAVDIMGGAPGTRETDLLSPDRAVEAVDALVLAGGSAFGLAAAGAVADALARAGRGFQVGPARVPIVPSAILFDLINGGDKNWSTNPYHALGEQALAAAFDQREAQFALGSVGAGTGATTANLKGGLGSASLVLASGITIGALVAVNPTGRVTVGTGPNFWAAPFEMGSEFGGLGPAIAAIPFAQTVVTKLDMLAPGANTTLGIVATNACLTKTQAKRVAVAAQDGIARAICPAHTPVDGDLVFAVSTGAYPLKNPLADVLEIGHGAAVCLSRAIARAVFEATPAPGDVVPCWREMSPLS